MALIRQAPLKNQKRTFAMRAFHKGIGCVVDVLTCSFGSMESEAIVAATGSKITFHAKMKDLVLLEHTNRNDVNGKPVYEGDRVRAEVENEYGSWEMLEGTVLFDQDKWGFSIEFDDKNRWARELTGLICDLEIIGNIFEHNEEGSRIQGDQKRA